MESDNDKYNPDLQGSLKNNKRKGKHGDTG